MVWCPDSYSKHWMQMYGWNGGQAGSGHGFHIAKLEWYQLDEVPTDNEADELAEILHDDLVAHVGSLDL